MLANNLGRMIAAAVFLGCTAAAAAAQQAGAKSPSEAQAPAAQPQTPALKPGYAGSETCKACHEEIYNRFQKSVHFAVETNKGRGWAGQSCESCHGPGSKHAESADAKDIRNPAKLQAIETDKTCLACHTNSETKVGRITSGHAKDQVACTSCHSVHGNDGRKLVTRKAGEINQQCASCHLSVWASFQKPYKHRLPEGAMSCTNCHNPHTSFRKQTMRASFGNEPSCFQCHSDKRGPFVFEHAPVRFEGCPACHEPHGSANPRMLTRHEVRFVCLECHANNPPPPTPKPAAGATVNVPSMGGVPPAFHDLRNPRFQNCTVCHTKVHGSFVDRELER
ncbi:MAG TPA: DmsE family decaheme c-type cytochrome [Bryobacteraceae bacterium]|nr:DmsE family decaheme c-type cytochrome [Bryobacteraceae bacterium]